MTPVCKKCGWGMDWIEEVHTETDPFSYEFGYWECSNCGSQEVSNDDYYYEENEEY